MSRNVAFYLKWISHTHLNGKCEGESGDMAAFKPCELRSIEDFCLIKIMAYMHNIENH